MRRIVIALLVTLALTPVAEARGLVTLRTSAGHTFLVAPSAAPMFRGFVREVERAGYRIWSIGGYRPHGSVRHSLHPSGLAIDINQTSRNRTSGFMYHVTRIAHRFGLKDGCEFSHPDCGHIEMSMPRHRRHGR